MIVVASLVIVILICVSIIIYLLLIKNCTLSRYLFVNHIFGLLTGPRREFFKTVFDSAHEINQTVQNKYIVPMFEDTLDYNLQLLLDGIDWSFLNEIVIKNKDCIVEFLKSDQNDTEKLNRCLEDIKKNIKGEQVVDMIRTVRRNTKERIDQFKFVKYEKLPARIRNNISEDAYYADIRSTKRVLKSWANNQGSNNLVTEEQY